MTARRCPTRATDDARDRRRRRSTPIRTMPPTLADTGLCIDAACTQIAADVYRVHAAVRAVVRRRDEAALDLPAARHDRSTRPTWTTGSSRSARSSGRSSRATASRVETRLIMRVGAERHAVNDWFYVAVRVERDAGRDDAASRVGVTNANGTQHDIPSRVAVPRCHENLKPSRVLGFAAIQLDCDGRGTASSISTDADRRRTAVDAAAGRGRRRTSRCPAPTTTNRRARLPARELRPLPQPDVEHVHDNDADAAAARPSARSARVAHDADVHDRGRRHDDGRHGRRRTTTIVDAGQPDHSVDDRALRVDERRRCTCRQLGTEMIDPTGADDAARRGSRTSRDCA